MPHIIIVAAFVFDLLQIKAGLSILYRRACRGFISVQVAANVLEEILEHAQLTIPRTRCEIRFSAGLVPFPYEQKEI